MLLFFRGSTDLQMLKNDALIAKTGIDTSDMSTLRGHLADFDDLMRLCDLVPLQYHTENTHNFTCKTAPTIRRAWIRRAAIDADLPGSSLRSTFSNRILAACDQKANLRHTRPLFEAAV